MDKVIYEAKPYYGLNPAFVVFCIVTIIVAIILFAFWKKVDIGVRCFVSFIIVFFLFVICCQIYTGIHSWYNIYRAYVLGNYTIAEGTIDEYTFAEEGQPNLPDRFSVGGVCFQAPGFVSSWGYPLKSSDGGVLKDGMVVRIHYVSYKYENVIMRIELLE